MDHDEVQRAISAWNMQADQQAAAWLVQRLSPVVRATVARRIFCRWRAEDVIQNTWIKFFRSLPAFEARIPVASWVALIARSACADAASTMMQPNAPLDELLEEAAAISPAFSDRERLRHVMHYRDSLNQTDRFIVDEVFFGDSAAREVGSHVGLSEAAVKMRASRLRRTMRELWCALEA